MINGNDLNALYQAQSMLWDEQALRLYVPPELKSSPQSEKTTQATETIDTWLASTQKVLLLLG